MVALLASVAIAGTPGKTDFDCPMRLYALQYAAAIQPFLTPSALQVRVVPLESVCSLRMFLRAYV